MEELMIKSFENSLKDTISKGLISFNFEVDEGTLIGPQRITDNKHYLIHKIKSPLEEFITYWIQADYKVYYKLTCIDSFHHSFYEISEDISEILKIDETLFKRFSSSIHFSLISFLCIKLMRDIGFKELRGNLLQYSLRSLVNPKSDLVLNLTKFRTDKQYKEDNILNLSLF